MSDDSNYIPPFVLPLPTIYNYSQFISNLVVLRNKYDPKVTSSKYFDELTVEDTKISKLSLFVPKKIYDDISITKVSSGFLQARLTNKMISINKETVSFVRKSLLKKICDLKSKKYELKSFYKKISSEDLNNLETFFDIEPPKEIFSSSSLYQIYSFLKERTEINEGFEAEISCLEYQYLSFLNRFLKENSHKISDKCITLEDKVRIFCLLRFDKNQKNLEVYHKRYLYAEIFVYFRMGKIMEIKNLFRENLEFFSHISNEFDKMFVEWYEFPQKRKNIRAKSMIMHDKLKTENCDAFRLFFYRLMAQLDILKCDSIVLNTFEDFLWFELINFEFINSRKKIISLFASLPVVPTFFVTTMMKYYEKSLDMILLSEFNLCDCYYISKELGKFVTYKTFVELVFFICIKFKDVKRTVKILKKLKEVLDQNTYIDVISENIIKNDLFEILIGENNEMVFEDEIYKRITEKIKDRNETSLLLKIYYLFEDDTLILNTLKNILQDSILNEASDQIPFADIIRYYEKIGVTSEWRNVKILKDFLNFKLNQTDETFNQLVFFRDEEIEKSFIIEAKYVFEKIVMLVSSYIQRHHRNDLARKVFIISGELGLSEDCLEYVRSKLVLMI
ncbi:hypothetical protein LUQ84_000634 [Hamiltosporidium tvaerminnensis]|nr:hypothetical protein LUQ84_000634 [Hamiltosporidium tvaerminnensis]